MQLFISEWSLDYRITRGFPLPHHSGSMIRGVLGRALRRTACAREQPCPHQCEYPEHCTYARLFDPPVSQPRVALQGGHTRNLKPLIPLIPKPGRLDLALGDMLSLGVRVLCRIRAAEEAFLVGTFAAVESFPIGRDGGRMELEGVRLEGPLNRCVSLTECAEEPERVVVELQTPTRIERDKQLAQPMDTKTLVYSLYRRLFTLSCLYGEVDASDEIDPASLKAVADSIHISQQDLQVCQWTRKGYPMVGLVGTLELTGALTRVVPWLRLAEWTHIGKDTSQGLGRIRMATR